MHVEGAAHNLWLDHLDISDGSDGNLDITNGADLVTVSWTIFHYSSKRTDPLAGASGHRFCNLIGAADTVTSDAGHLNVTFHHVWWSDNVNQRMPRVRFGESARVQQPVHRVRGQRLYRGRCRWITFRAAGAPASVRG